MVSTTELFLDIQRVYVNQAQKDREQMAALITKILGARNLPAETIDGEELTLFCKNCAQIRVIKMRSIEEEL